MAYRMQTNANASGKGFSNSLIEIRGKYQKADAGSSVFCCP